MYSLSEAQNIVQRHLTNIKFPEEPKELYEPVKYILSLGGKRIRPALVLLACDMFQGAVDSALHPATAIEVFHNFTLVHDDIMDKSALRRGKDTVHVKWDQNIGILSGDVMSIFAFRFLNSSPGAVLRGVHDVFTKTAIQVCEGQQLDMNFEKRDVVTESEYLNMIELKTAVLIAASLKIGAMLGGASETEANNLYNYGRDLGIAFQLQDDLLDTYGDPDLFGKTPGMDIVDNKKTLLMIRALEDADEEMYHKLTGWLQARNFDSKAKVKEVIQIFDALDVKHKIESRIQDYYESSLQHLRKLNCPEDRKTELFSFADYIMNREK